MKRLIRNIGGVCLLACACVACGSSNNKAKQEEQTEEQAFVQAPAFNADSAYAYVEKQVAFGTRVPNSAPHKACGDDLADKLAGFGAKVYNQYADLMAYDGTMLKARIIIGAYNP